MNNQSVKIVSAAVSDRGLSQKRPLNEDSFLADAERRIFAVADGVGGAQAGEVASQTAMEVLDEAFRHQEDGADVEDLMEIAIQRANSSIHQMAREHPKLQMMATTIVALHLDGHVATIGHVGDSRLYRLTPDGKLHRETRDHSVVEEEVRAGRMTPAQAAHHPSRNVISRALGAEDGVEVDMKTIEVADGTSFLLCSDGITRHLPDTELSQLLNSNQDLDSICAEMKRRCYERGAEDNLTAVIVRVGEHAADAYDDERTVTLSRSSLAATISGDYKLDDPALHETVGIDDSSLHETVDAVRPLSPNPVASASAESQAATPQLSSLRRDAVQATPTAAPPPHRRRSILGTLGMTLFFLLLVAGVGLAAFFGGMYKQRRDTQAVQTEQAAATPAPTPANPASEFDRKRHEVDQSPAKMASQLASQQGNKPLDSNDPEFLYLYGRALLLSGKYSEASTALKKAADLLKNSPARDQLKIETKLAAVVAAIKMENQIERDNASKALDEVIDTDGKSLPPNGQLNSNSNQFTTGTNGALTSPVEVQR
ncbi:MAG TPA: protein phosphatase 2C domain-containing protein [Pyrinomonadaceae bacterium]|jgi:protein phosphatase